MFSLKHLLIQNLRLRVIVGGMGIFASILLGMVNLSAQDAAPDDKSLLAEVSAASPVLSSSSVVSVATIQSGSLSDEASVRLGGKLPLDLISRIEDLPKEKLKLIQESQAGSESLNTAIVPRKMAEYWKPLLVTLVAHNDNSTLRDAAAKVEETLSVSEKIGFAMLVQEGLDIADREAPAMEARLQTTEALVAQYVYSVMISRRNDEWWQNWRDAWNRGITRIPRELVGQWSVIEESGVNFAQATIANQRCTLIWQERTGGKVQKIDFNVVNVKDSQLFSDESTDGLRFELQSDSKSDLELSFDVPGHKANSILKVRLRPDW